MKRNVKIFCAALALVLVFGVVVGGTIAWLIDETDTLTNTFTIGNVDISLTENNGELDASDSPKSQDFSLIPGTDIPKDPTVTVTGGSEGCWLFVKVEEDIKEGLIFKNYVDYSVVDGWTLLEGESNVYWRAVENNAEDQEFTVLTGDKVTVPNTVTKADMDNLDGKNPTLSFTAYACQKDTNFQTAAAAWAEVSKVPAN